MNVESHYENLKVTRDAPPEVIRAAYKVLAQNLHPDKNPHPEAAEYMVLINAAYETLSEAAMRVHYDRWLESEELKWSTGKPPATKRGKLFEIDWDAVDKAMKKQQTRFKPRSAVILSIAAAAMSLVGIISSRSP
jgi:DnaJ-class molecular chaperone